MTTPETAVRRAESKGKWHLVGGFTDTACGMLIYSEGVDYRPFSSLKAEDVCWLCRKRQRVLT